MRHARRIWGYVGLAALMSLSTCTDSQDTRVVEPVIAQLDTVPPLVISDARLSFTASTNTADLVWTAPVDPGSVRVERYDIRFAYGDSFAWEDAIAAVDPPIPRPPGNRQTHRFRYPKKGHLLHVAIASLDASGNRSLTSNVASLRIPGFTFAGTCVDVYTGSPVAGIDVEITAGDNVFTLTTDARGEFSQSDLAPQDIEVRTVFQGADPSHFNVYGSFRLVEHISHTFLLIPYRRSEVMPSLSLLGLFKIATRTGGISGELRKWRARPVPIYIPAFINSHGLDYGETGRATALHWMDRTGFALFEFVDSPPDVGIELHFKTRDQMGGQIGFTRPTQDADGLPLKDDVSVIDEFSNADALYRVILHELGHTIRFGHLPDRQFLMYAGQPLPGDLTDDEVELVRLLEALPNQIDMVIYSDPEP